MRWLWEHKRKIFIVCLLGIALAGVFGREPMAKKFSATGDYFFGGGSYYPAFAAKWYRLALMADTNVPYAHYQLGRIYFVQNDFARARAELESEREHNPSFPKTYYMLGLVNGFDNRLDEAEVNFTKVIELGHASDEGRWGAYNDLAWIQFQKGEFQKAQQTSEEGLVLFPENPWLLNSLGIALLNRDEHVRAVEVLAGALSFAERLTIEAVRKAYPGNNPDEAEKKRDAILSTIRLNLSLARSGVDN